MRLRKARGIQHGRAAVLALAVVLAVMLLLDEAPYRIFFSAGAERIRFADLRCYVIGEHRDEWLIHCPDIAPPRNRVIKQNDPRIRKFGVVESVFTDAEPDSREQR